MKKCGTCNIEKELTEFHRAKKSYDGRQSKCRTCCSDYRKKWVKDNPKYHKEYLKKYQPEYQKKYFQDNKEYILKRRINYLNNNKLARLTYRLRLRTSAAFTAMNYKKDSTTAKLLGADFQIVYNYIENLFTDDMSWEKFKYIHIDHKIPLCSARNERELRQLCHYTNLQPLWAIDNLRKGSKF